MREGDEDAADVDVAEGGGEVEVRVGEAGGGGVGVVEEVGVRLEDAGCEEGVVGVDCAADAEGGFDPGGGGARSVRVERRGEGRERLTSWRW